MNRSSAAQRRREEQKDNVMNQSEYFLSNQVSKTTKPKSGVNRFQPSVSDVRMSKVVPFNKTGKTEAFVGDSRSHRALNTFRSGGQAPGTLPVPSVKIKESLYYRINAVDTVGETIVVKFQ
jgi:hypothetical protein